MEDHHNGRHGESLGSVYTKHRHQRYDNSAMTLAIIFSLTTMKSFENGLQRNSIALMRTVW